METLNVSASVGLTRAIPLLFAGTTRTLAVEPLWRRGIPESVPGGFVCVSTVSRQRAEAQQATVPMAQACGLFIGSLHTLVTNARGCL